MGVFGGAHTDGFDLAAGYSCMLTCSDIPSGYEDGRFHLLGLGVYVRLDKVPMVFFTGRLRHGGTPPLAPPHVTEVDPSAYRCVVICYPSSPIINGVVQTPMAASDRARTAPLWIFPISTCKCRMAVLFPLHLLVPSYRVHS